MKKLGIALIVIGIVITIFSGIAFQREDTIVEIGDYEITREEEKEVTWPRWAGVAVVAAGVIIFFIGRKQ